MLFEHSVGSNINNAWTPQLAVHSRHVTTKSLWWWRGWTHWIIFMTSLCIYTYIYLSIYLSLPLSVYIYIIHIYIYIYSPSALWWLEGMVFWALCVIVAGFLFSRGSAPGYLRSEDGIVWLWCFFGKRRL